jgi:O-antigen ligase
MSVAGVRSAIGARPAAWPEARPAARAPLSGWALAALAVAPLAAWGLVHEPWLTAGAIVGAGVFAFTLARPLVVVGAMLLLGPIDLSFLTGGQKSLFEEMGGLDMNGIRLIGVVVALAAIALVEPGVLRHALGRQARWYLVFLAYAAATLVMSDSVVDGMRLLLKLAYPFVVFLAVLSVARTRADLERLADWTLAGAMFIALLVAPAVVAVGAYEVDGHGRFLFHGLGQNAFSFYLLAMILLAFARFVARRQARYLLVCAALVPWMLLTLTRITLGAAAIGLLALALLAAIAARDRRVLIAAIVLGVAVIGPVLPIALIRTFGYVPTPAELWALVRDPIALVQSMNWQGRQIFWAVVGKAFLAKPVFGEGLGSSTAILLRNFPREWGTVVHNEYLRLAVETGVVGVGLFILAAIRWALAIVRTARTDDLLTREFALAAIGTLAAAAIIAITDNALDYYAQFSQYIGFLAAAAIASAPANAPAPAHATSHAPGNAPANAYAYAHGSVTNVVT